MKIKNFKKMHAKSLKDEKISSLTKKSSNKYLHLKKKN